MNKLYIFVGILIIAVAGYWIFFVQSTSFDDGLRQINSFWGKQELKPYDLTVSAKVNFIEEIKLNTLKSDLESFKNSIESQPDSQDKQELLMLADIHISLVSNALMQKKNFALIDLFENSDYDSGFLCSSLDKAEELSSSLASQKEMILAYNGKIDSFSESFPEEAKTAEVPYMRLQANSDEQLLQFSSIIVSLKGVC